MRFWFSGPRFMGIRPGVSLGKEDFGSRPARAPQKSANSASPSRSYSWDVNSRLASVA